MNNDTIDIKQITTVENNNKIMYFVVKRLFDIILGLIGIIILIPTIIIVKIASMCTGDFKSIFFVQERIGLKGKKIKIFKFRSMIPNAEEKLEELMKTDPKIREEYTKNKKLACDPRITKIGNFIRKFSIDELPQLINVFIGNMTLVGPRPYLPREIDDMGDYYKYVIACKPGLTGLWQVSGRSDVSFKHRLKLDKKYTLERNFKYDCKIFFKTFNVVLGSKGAK